MKEQGRKYSSFRKYIHVYTCCITNVCNKKVNVPVSEKKQY